MMDPELAKAILGGFGGAAVVGFLAWVLFSESEASKTAALIVFLLVLAAAAGVFVWAALSLIV